MVVRRQKDDEWREHSRAGSLAGIKAKVGSRPGCESIEAHGKMD